LLVITVVCYGIMSLLYWGNLIVFTWYDWIIPAFLFIQGYFTGLLVRSVKPGTREFTLFFLGATVLRLLLSLILVGLIVYLNPEHGVTFAILFLATYLIYLIFEIYSLIANLRSHFEKQ